MPIRITLNVMKSTCCATRLFILIALLAGLGLGNAVEAARSDEEVIRKTQTANYNLITGNWDVRLEMSSDAIAGEFKRFLPELNFALVEEETDEGRINLTFRGEGDEKLVIKLKPMGKETNVRIRHGLTGSEAKSLQLFSYVYKRM